LTPLHGHDRNHPQTRPRLDIVGIRRIIGRIVLYPHLKDRQWFWIITARERIPTLSDLGYAASREQAFADFKARWEFK
jgi:hypothetical protein